MPLPTWLIQAWTRLDPERDGLLASALTAWHQGLLLFTMHPSMALVAFVAAVESVASSKELVAELPPLPDACPSCGNVPAAAARFWAAVALVGDDEDEHQLRRAKVYRLRSTTGHRGAVHGFENRLGAFVTLPLNQMDDAGRFVGDTLRRIARVGRALLIRMSGGVPDP